MKAGDRVQEESIEVPQDRHPALAPDHKKTQIGTSRGST